MEKFVIEGGVPLSGTIRIQGAKNATLPILAATVLAEGIHVLSDVPNLADISGMCRILEFLGAKINRKGTTLRIDTTCIDGSFIPHELMSQMRSSIFLLGPLLTRCKQVRLTRPGGCDIGERPIDIHLKSLTQLGATVVETDNLIRCSCPGFMGAEIELSFPSVGATENAMMAAVLARGKTIISNAAREPEIVDLEQFLVQMGAKIEGAGTSTIQIEGVEYLNSATYQIMPDRIVASTMITAVAVTAGEVMVENVVPEHLSSVLEVLQRAGVNMESKDDKLWVTGPKRLQAVGQVVTAPYPGFPTDVQPQLLALLSISEGKSVINETIFESRLKHADQLNKMGANLHVKGNKVWINGVSQLKGAEVSATDLRAGAALVIAGLACPEKTIVLGVEHIDRGYENLEESIMKLGGHIARVTHSELVMNQV